jgi:hypothetical protein
LIHLDKASETKGNIKCNNYGALAIPI